MTAQARPPRTAALFTVRDTLATRAGNSAYLDGFAATLKAADISTRYHVLASLPDGALRMPAPQVREGLYAGVERWGGLRVGHWFYARDPARWAHRLFMGRRRGARSGGRGDDGLWRLDPPEPGALAWARDRLAQMKPRMIVANYFNAADVFSVAPQGAVRAILVHDVLSLRAETLAAAGIKPDFDLGMIARETVAFRSADICFAIKTAEAERIREAAPGVEVRVAPFAIEAPPPRADAPRQPLCLFVGSDNGPNRDGLDWLLDTVWPEVRRLRPDARLRVIGTVGQRRSGTWPEGAELAGFVEDLDAEYAAAALALTPLRFGSGVKIKLVEALAASVPCVATPVGADGVEGAPPGVLDIAADPGAFARAVAAGLSAPDAPLRRAAARAFAIARHGPGALGPGLVAGLL